MPFTSDQLAQGARYAIKSHEKNDPIDQINVKHVTLDWFLKNKKQSAFGNGYHTENVYTGNDSNYQNYFGADQVTYNGRDPVRQVEYPWFNNHDGFYFDEDMLAQNGIILTDDNAGSPTRIEVERLADLLEQSYRAVKNSIQVGLATETLLDGTQSTKAVPGLDLLCGTSPNDDVVGGLDANTYTFWRNQTNLGINTGSADLVVEMEKTLQGCIRRGNKVPNFIVAGQAFIDAYRAKAGSVIQRQMTIGPKGGVGMDAAITDLSFRTVPIVYDPMFEEMDTLLGAITYPWTKRCYFLNSDAISFRPMKGHWMVDRKPERLPDRYVHYFGKTSKYGMSTNQRNALGVLSIA